MFTTGFFNISETEPLEINPENAIYYQENSCVFSIYEILGQINDSYDVKIFNSPDGNIECYGKNSWYEYVPEKLVENGWAKYESDYIKIWFASNLNLDLLVQSIFWFVLFSLIKRNDDNKINKHIFISFLNSSIFYLHLIGEKEYYKSISREFDLDFVSREFDGSLFIENYFLYLFIFSIFSISYFFLFFSKTRIGFINYLPFIFLIYGTYTSLNLNFYYIGFCAIGIQKLFEKKYNKKFLIIFILIATFWLLNLQEKHLIFDVDKLRGYLNSNQSYFSLIFWTISFYLLTNGLIYFIKDNFSFFNPELFRRNLLISSSLIYLIGWLSAKYIFVNYISYYFLGLNKFGMNSLESIAGNTWRGIAPSAEAMGEFFAFVILFTIIFSTEKKIKLSNLEILIFIPTFFGLYKTNNFTAIITSATLIMIYFLSKNIDGIKKIIFGIILVFIPLMIIYSQSTNEFSFSNSSDKVLYEGLRATKFTSDLSENQFGLNAAQQANYQYVLDLPNEESNLSSSLRFLIQQYNNNGNIKNLPHVVSVFSFVSLIINRSEKWGIFFAKYNPNLQEFLFGYGPQQFTHYYLDHQTNFNYGLFLPHSSVLSYLLFFGMFGLMILLYLIIKIFSQLETKAISKYLILFLLINFIKSDSLLYLPNFIFMIFIFNFFIFENIEASKKIKDGKTLKIFLKKLNFKVIFSIISISLATIYFLNLKHSLNVDILVDASYGVAEGTPPWKAFQNRLLGPYILRFMTYLGFSKYFSFISFIIIAILFNNVIFYICLSKLKLPFKKSILWITIFNTLFISFQHSWLYIWDFIDISFYIIYYFLISKNKFYKELLVINFLHIFNRETALIMTIVILFYFIQSRLDRKYKSFLITGLTFNLIFGSLYTYFSREYLFIKKAYFTLGIETEGNILGGNWFTLNRFLEYAFKGKILNITINLLIFSLIVSLTLYIIKNFRDFSNLYKIYSVAYVLNIFPIFLLGDFTETRLYFPSIVLLIYFLVNLDKSNKLQITNNG